MDRRPITRKVITPGRNWPVRGRGGWVGGKRKFGSPRSDVVARGGEEQENPAPGEADHKELGDCSVVLIPVQWITANKQVAGRASPWERACEEGLTI